MSLVFVTEHATVGTEPGKPETGGAEPLWTDPGIKSGIRMPELISTLKKKKGGGGGGGRERIVEHSPKNLALD